MLRHLNELRISNHCFNMMIERETSTKESENGKTRSKVTTNLPSKQNLGKELTKEAKRRNPIARVVAKSMVDSV